jgi:hypothetical protein
MPISNAIQVADFTIAAKVLEFNKPTVNGRIYNRDNIAKIMNETGINFKCLEIYEGRFADRVMCDPTRIVGTFKRQYFDDSCLWCEWDIRTNNMVANAIMSTSDIMSKMYVFPKFVGKVNEFNECEVEKLVGFGLQIIK